MNPFHQIKRNHVYVFTVFLLELGHFIYVHFADFTANASFHRGQEKDDTIILKPKSFLGSEDFAKIAHIVRTNKGEYISAGKESHFKIPKED